MKKVSTIYHYRGSFTALGGRVLKGIKASLVFSGGSRLFFVFVFFFFNAFPSRHQFPFVS